MTEPPHLEIRGFLLPGISPAVDFLCSSDDQCPYWLWCVPVAVCGGRGLSSDADDRDPPPG